MPRNNKSKGVSKKAKQRTLERRRQSAVSEAIMDACHLVKTLMADPTPPFSAMATLQRMTARVPEEAAPFVQLCIGYLDYLNIGCPATGRREQLTPFKNHCFNGNFGWLYNRLSVYCHLSETIITDDVSAFINEAIAQVKRDVEADDDIDDNHLSTSSSALMLHLLNVPVPRAAAHINDHIHDWLDHLPNALFDRKLVKSLSAFLKLKSPTPHLKTTTRLDLALSQVKWSVRSHLWERTLSGILSTLILHRAPTSYRQLDAWKSVPHLYSLLANVNQSSTLPSLTDERNPVSIKEIGLWQWRVWEKGIEPEKMEYHDRLKFELTRLRVFSHHDTGSSQDSKCVLQQLERVLILLSSDTTPPHQCELAKKVLIMVAEFIVDDIDTYVPLPGDKQLWQRLMNQAPDDYRIHLLSLLAGVRGEGPVNHWLCIDFRLFYFAFYHHLPATEREFLERFYFSLSNETKKSFIIELTGRLLTGGESPEQCDRQWKRFCKVILSPNLGPVKQVLSGGACEIPFLFCVILSVLNSSKKDVSWVSDKQQTLLANYLLEYSDKLNPFGRKQMVKLLNQIVKPDRGLDISASWSTYVAVALGLPEANRLTSFYSYILDVIDLETQQHHKLINQLIEQCRRIPELRKKLKRVEHRTEIEAY